MQENFPKIETHRYELHIEQQANFEGSLTNLMSSPVRVCNPNRNVCEAFGTQFEN